MHFRWALVIAPSLRSKIHGVFTARQISSPCENDRFSFVIDHSQPNRKTNEANTASRSGCRSHPVSNERENGGKSQWIEMDVHDTPAIYPVTRLAAVTCRLDF
ncbi:Uncharacterized protein DBV15_08984 [Temnothorax longispinosus]|uniref:Uncharacterized protein n=1 Tax=Temnothorax longispinosus TaxID=300112 RepID=A0A4S2JIT9_9HYME|nr:Uncharacterized protein DBV15_08984 [Temnothorax longispinosus]